MGDKHLIDSNTIIDYLNGKLPAQAMQQVSDAIDSDAMISVITKIETLGYNTTVSAYQILHDFISELPVIDLDQMIVERTIALRKSHRIKLSDAIIAATALVFNLTLITRNTADFNRITGIAIIDPWQF